MAIFEAEWNERDKRDHYYAQIAYQLYLCLFMFGGTPKRTLESFLLDFKLEKTENPAAETVEEMKERIEAQQMMFINAFSLAAKASVGPEVRAALAEERERNRKSDSK